MTPTDHRQSAPAISCLVIAALFALPAGCGYSGGEALFMTGLFKRPKIEAEIKLNEGAVAILVDDLQERCYWPEVTAVLADKVAKELTDKNATKTLIPTTKISRLRQAKPDFDDLSAREIGELLEADRLITIDVTEFFATEDPTESNSAARMSVAVKVLNPHEKKIRSKVRLWPRSPVGAIAQAELSAGQVTRAKNRNGILQALTEALAEKIVKNFYDRKMEDFERP